MEQAERSTPHPRKGKQLSQEERIQIEVLLRSGETAVHIARLLGRPERTVRRERQRGWLTYRTGRDSAEERYNAVRGQTVYERRRKTQVPAVIDPQLAAFPVEQIALKRCSPAVAAYRMKDEPYAVCMKTVYHLINHGRVPGVSDESLWEKRQRKRRYRPVHRIRKRAVAPGHSITDRPAAVETRGEFGHWEIDLIVSEKGALLSLTERKTRRLILRKLNSRSQAAVIGVLNEIERQMGVEAFRIVFKSITPDNGSELLDHAGMERSVGRGRRTHLYYAHPYSAWERGGNENTNRFIRRFIPKGRKPGRISRKMLHEIELWINTYPRKILNFETAEKRFNQEIAA